MRLLKCLGSSVRGQCHAQSTNTDDAYAHSVFPSGGDCFTFVLLLQDLAVGRLREAEVHHFVHQLVHGHKVVTDALLLQLLKVFLKHLHTETRPLVCSASLQTLMDSDSEQHKEQETLFKL